MFIRFCLLFLFSFFTTLNSGSIVELKDRVSDYYLGSIYWINTESLVSNDHSKYYWSSIFEPFNTKDYNQSWCIEHRIGEGFAQQNDWTNALYSFERSQVLLNSNSPKIYHLRLQYAKLIALYMLQKFNLIIPVAERLLEESKGVLEFDARQDVLVILFDVYNKTGFKKEAGVILSELREYSVEKSDRIALYSAFLSASKEDLIAITPIYMKNDVMRAIDFYEKGTKSPIVAGMLSGICPGLGSVYIGDYQTGALLFALNIFSILLYSEFHNKGLYVTSTCTGVASIAVYSLNIGSAVMSAMRYNSDFYYKVSNQFIRNNKLSPYHLIRIDF